MKPIIGVTARYLMDGRMTFSRVDIRNMNAIIDNGGVPVVLATTREEELMNQYIEMIDGLYFTGGIDISPLEYGEDPIPELKTTTPEHDYFEKLIYLKAAEQDMPILGVCRGVQLMNVAAGGSLYQDIYVQHEGTNDHNPTATSGVHPYHRVSINQETLLHKIFNRLELGVNTHHHQAVKKLGDGYIASGIASDGIVEAIESTKLTFAVGVQWHPEEMYEAYPEFNRLYRSFIEAADKHKTRKNSGEFKGNKDV